MFCTTIRVVAQDLVERQLNRTERYKSVLDYFRESKPEVGTELNFASAFQLLCATILSAQCTDKRVNEVTPDLFARYPTPQLMAQAEPEDLLVFIASVSYPNSKARHLVAMARKIVDDFDGMVPKDMEQLLTLPGVGRKTANVVRAVWFHEAAMAVDTHVFRVAHRIGLVPRSANTPEKVEKELLRHIPKEDIPRAHHWLLLHGRYVCRSAKPLCSECPFDSFCPKLLADSKLRT